MKVHRVAKQLLLLLNSTCHERVKLSVSGGEILAASTLAAFKSLMEIYVVKKTLREATPF